MYIFTLFFIPISCYSLQSATQIENTRIECGHEFHEQCLNINTETSFNYIYFGKIKYFNS